MDYSRLTKTLYFIPLLYTISALQLRISPSSLRNHPTTVAANSPFSPPIQVEIVNETTGLLETTGPNSEITVYVSVRNSNVRISNSSFRLQGGIGYFHGSLCDYAKNPVFLLFECNSTKGLLSTGLIKPILITNEINFAYFRPNDGDTALHDCLENFMHFTISCMNDPYCSKSVKYHYLRRNIKLKTYKYTSQVRSKQIEKYLEMKKFHIKNPEKKAHAIIGLNDNLVSKTLLPLMMDDKYSVTSYQKDNMAEFGKYAYFNRIYPSDDNFMYSVFMYLQKRRWDKLLFVYSVYEMDNFKFQHIADSLNMTILKYRITRNEIKTSDYHVLFQYIIKTGYRIILTSVTQEVAKTLIIKASIYNVTSENEYQWIGLRNVKDFDFLFQSKNVGQNVIKDDHVINKLDSVYISKFKGMIFISMTYPINVRNDSAYKSMLNQFLSTTGQGICRKIIHTNEYASGILPFALAHDVLLAYIYALKTLISANSSIDGISLSGSMRNKQFIGMTGEVSLNPDNGNRDDFIGKIYIVWPGTLHTNDKLYTFGRNIYNVILFQKKGGSIIQRKLLNFDLLMLMLKMGTDHVRKLYNCHIPLSHENDTKRNMSLLNVIRTIDCKGYFHYEYQMFVDNPFLPLNLYNWYLPKMISNCVQETKYSYDPPPFHCEFGCGGVQDKNNVLIFNNGECIAHNVCKCNDLNWHGPGCSIPVCRFCDKDHGTCILPDKCNCSEGYLQPNCSIPSCMEDCLINGGTCVKPNVCECDDTHYGQFCNKTCTCIHGTCDKGIFGKGHCKECTSEYYGLNCESSYITLCLYIILAIIFVWFVTYMGYKTYRKELQLKETLTNNDWVINWADVRQDDIIGKGNMIISAISTNCNKFTDRKSLNIGIWGDFKVYYQKIDKDTINISREIQLEIRQVREMSHANIVSLLGCSIQAPNVAIFTELQSKGSLRDILLNTDIDIPWKFRFSMMKDICKGLSYIHSGIKSHGRLKSSNCLVDNKWNVKLSGFGLHQFRSTKKDIEIFNIGMPREGISGAVGSDFASLLWTSPEILRKGVYHINHVGGGSAHGDIYSFGMILSEFCTMKLPFSDLELDKAHLINLIAGFQNASHLKVWNDYITKNNFEEGVLIRPCIQDKQLPPQLESMRLLKDLIDNCWDEDPRMRPSCKECEIMLYKVDFQRTDPMEHLVDILETYSTNLENVVHRRNEQLQLEVKKTDNLVSRLLPKVVAEDLKQGKNVEWKNFENVTIFFSNIVGFSFIAKSSNAAETVTLMTDVYGLFDSLISTFDFYRVEAVGESYMFVSGLFGNVSKHTDHVCEAALSLKSSFNSFDIAPSRNEKLQLQVGIHTGNVVGAIVGLKTPRYCLFGDAVNIAVMTESIARPSSIFITEDTLQCLKNNDKFDLEIMNDIKYKSLLIKTYCLKGRQEFEFGLNAC